MTEMMRKYSDSIKSAAWIYGRFQQHEAEHSQPQRNDPEMWREVDFNSADPELAGHFIANLRSLAQFNKHWDDAIAKWCDQALERRPVHLRQRGDKWTTNENNVMIWRLMMLFREVVQQELAMMEPNNFNDHFDLS